MTETTIGLLHPGEMGAAVGKCLASAGHRVLWDPEGRSAATKERAEAAGLTEVALAEIIARSEVIMSVCPPHAAVDARVVPLPGTASAVKMAYASWTKGSAALLLATRALARAEGVESVLLEEWGISQPGLERRSSAAAGSAAAKGWRWVAEMEEIAATMAAAGLPEGFHQAAAEISRGFSADAEALG